LKLAKDAASVELAPSRVLAPNAADDP